MDKVQNHISFTCNTPSPEPFRINLFLLACCLSKSNALGILRIHFKVINGNIGLSYIVIIIIEIYMSKLPPPPAFYIL
jgi:hypothetical protein